MLTNDGINAVHAPAGARAGAVEVDPQSGFAEELGRTNVDKVLETVDAGLIGAAETLEAERAGRDRSTLTVELERRLAADDENEPDDVEGDEPAGDDTSGDGSTTG